MLSLRASSPIGRFVCARDDAAVLPLLLVHFNIMLYAMSYWITQVPNNHASLPCHGDRHGEIDECWPETIDACMNGMHVRV